VDEKLLFFSTFIRYPKEIGSVIPSSRFLVNELMKSIDFKTAECIVEYGPGTGTITHELLKRAKKDARLLCFETNRKFCNYLRKNIKDDRLTVINDSAENIKKHVKVSGISKVDYIISGLPFSTLPVGKRSVIIEEAKGTLKTEGKFVVYQFLSSFKKSIGSYFSRISTKFVPLNIPPCFVFVCEK